MHYTMTIAGVQRDLPICKVTDDLYIGAFVIFGDVELTVATAGALLKKAYVDKAKIKESYGSDIAAEAIAALPMIVFE